VWWIVGSVAVIVLTATYLTWTASRVDRLHARATASAAGLDAALVRRAVAAIDLAPAAHAAPLRPLARASLEAPPGEREAAENALTKALRDLPYATDAPAMTEVVAASRRVSLARHVHNDLVRDALGMRRRRLVRAMRISRKHPVPAYFDIEDPQL
jgi:hypothetical protein